MNIQLHIDRLVLDGVNVAPGQQHLLQAAVETELRQLLTVGGLSPPLASGVALPRIASPSIQLNAAASTAEIGRQIAGSVYRGIGK